MKIENIIRTKIKERQTTQQELAEKTGFKSQANIAGLLNNTKNGMRSDNMIRLLEALDCDIIVRDRVNGNEWIVTEE